LHSRQNDATSSPRRASCLIVIQGFHLPFPGDPRNLGRPVMAAMLRLWNRHLIADSHQMAEVLRESELDWTLIRMPLLTAGPAAGATGSGIWPWGRGAG
jgi:hypothetical protein